MKTLAYPLIQQYIEPSPLVLTKPQRRRQIKATLKTPQVRYHQSANLLWLSGNSTEQGKSETWSEINEIMEEHLERNEKLNMVLDLRKINHQSIIALMHAFNNLKNGFRNGKDIIVTWMISLVNDEMMELAFEMSALYGIKIEIRPY